MSDSSRVEEVARALRLVHRSWDGNTPTDYIVTAEDSVVLARAAVAALDQNQALLTFSTEKPSTPPPTEGGTDDWEPTLPRLPTKTVTVTRITRRAAPPFVYRDDSTEGSKSIEGELVTVPKSALAWLFGEGPDVDGDWFGDVSAEERPKGAFWWRTHFRKLIGAVPKYDKATRTIRSVIDPPPSQEGELVKRLRRALTTLMNDDLSGLGTDKRARHIERLETLEDAILEIERLRKVLEPFGKAAEMFAWPVHARSDEPIESGETQLTVGDLRAARSALKGGKE